MASIEPNPFFWLFATVFLFCILDCVSDLGCYVLPRQDGVDKYQLRHSRLPCASARQSELADSICCNSLYGNDASVRYWFHFGGEQNICPTWIFKHFLQFVLHGGTCIGIILLFYKYYVHLFLSQSSDLRFFQIPVETIKVLRVEKASKLIRAFENSRYVVIYRGQRRWSLLPNQQKIYYFYSCAHDSKIRVI
jgi:hypothetical protein